MNQSAATTARPRLAVVVSHPIQYYAPFYRALAAEGSVELKVFFCSRIGVDPILDPGMGVPISWNTDLLSGYESEFLPEAAGIRRAAFFEVNNPSISKRLKSYDPDVVLIHGYALVSMLRAMAWCRWHRVPLLNISDRSLFGLTTDFRRSVRRILVPLILKQYTAFLVISDAVHKFYASFGARDAQIFRVPSMLDDAFWECRERRGSERKRLRAELNLADDFAVLFVGKLIPRKRPGDLVNAMQRLASRPPTKRRIRLIVAGDGTLRRQLKEEAQAAGVDVTFVGFVNINELPSYYSAADALAHPAENESFGMIVVEAATFGLPLILTDRVGAVGPTSIARPGRNAIVYRAGDTEALADAIQRLANEPATCNEMSAESLELAKDHEGPVSVENALAAIGYCLAQSRKPQRRV